MLLKRGANGKRGARREIHRGQANLLDDRLARRLRGRRAGKLRLGRPRRGGARLRQRPREIYRHPPLRAPDVRGDALLGDRRRTRDRPPVERDYAAIWRLADKVVYSKTLRTVSSSRTRIERAFEVEAVRRKKAQAGRDISVGGPGLAARALEAGLVDELRLFVTPIVVGGGKRSLPKDVRLELELLDERRFGSGMVYLHYRTGRTR